MDGTFREEVGKGVTSKKDVCGSNGWGKDKEKEQRPGSICDGRKTETKLSGRETKQRNRIKRRE